MFSFNVFKTEAASYRNVKLHAGQATVDLCVGFTTVVG